MFRQMVINILQSAEGQRLIDRNVRAILEDTESTTRRGMMRIIRGEAKDVIGEATERQRELAEMDPSYQEWAQQRRQVLMEEDTATRAAMGTFVRTGVIPELPDPLVGFTVDRVVRVTDDALFSGRYGRVVSTANVMGFPEVHVMLEGHTLWMTFTPGALELIDDTERPWTAPADPTIEAARTTELPPADEQ